MVERDLAQQLVLEPGRLALSRRRVVGPRSRGAPALGVQSLLAKCGDHLLVDRRERGQEDPRIFTEPAAQLDERGELVSCVLSQALERRCLSHPRPPLALSMVTNATGTV